MSRTQADNKVKQEAKTGELDRRFEVGKVLQVRLQLSCSQLS